MLVVQTNILLGRERKLSGQAFSRNGRQSQNMPLLVYRYISKPRNILYLKILFQSLFEKQLLA
jgi:hypothetical protein